MDKAKRKEVEKSMTNHYAFNENRCQPIKINDKSMTIMNIIANQWDSMNSMKINENQWTPMTVNGYEWKFNEHQWKSFKLMWKNEWANENQWYSMKNQ